MLVGVVCCMLLCFCCILMCLDVICYTPTNETYHQRTTKTQRKPTQHTPILLCLLYVVVFCCIALYFVVVCRLLLYFVVVCRSVLCIVAF